MLRIILNVITAGNSGAITLCMTGKVEVDADAICVAPTAIQISTLIHLMLVAEHRGLYGTTLNS